MEKAFYGALHADVRTNSYILTLSVQMRQNDFQRCSRFADSHHMRSARAKGGRWKKKKKNDPISDCNRKQLETGQRVNCLCWKDKYFSWSERAPQRAEER